MKRLLKAAFFLAMVFVVSTVAGSIAGAMDWHVADGVSVKWDAVTTDAAGNPFAEGGIEYAVYSARIDKVDPMLLWRGPETQAALTLMQQGRFLLGIKSILVVDGKDVAESDMAWSDDPEIVADGAVFGVMFFTAPAKPGGFGKQ